MKICQWDPDRNLDVIKVEAHVDIEALEGEVKWRAIGYDAAD